MKRAGGLIVLMMLTLMLSLSFMGCNNYFHDLIPPDENRIVSFSVKGMIDRAAISDNAVDATVDNTSPISSLVPRIEVSPKATLLPLTYEYLSAAFPNADILRESAAVYKARDLSEYVMNLIKRNPNFNVPAVNKPIDFSGPVNFLVISGQGTIRQYTVNVVKDTGEPRILGFAFSKYDNPELIRDAFASVNHGAKAVSAAALYPAEMSVSYALIPSFEILGDRLEIDGAEIKSGVDAIQFAQFLGTQTRTITVWRNGASAEFALTMEFAEDPDSIRSIIDFRFNKAGNAGIAATAVGSIANSNALGTINAQVFYSGARPAVLTPAFLSPGTVSVAGVTQVSGGTSHDFSQIIEYRVVSRNNLYTRAYTVVVDFIDVASSAPIFTSFKFSSGLNHELVQDTESQISDSASLIMITARYGGSYPPEALIPEFRATGLVTVFGSVQTSGFSAQNFSTQIKYTVTNPENSLLKRDYWVQVTFIRDTSSAAQINSFSFHPDENPGLADEIEGRIDQSAGTITVFAPVGSGITSRTMIPRFRASGQALVDGDVQISGTSGHLFNAPVVYEAVSANGAVRKTYTVTVRELQSTIFVNQRAYGHGDGASWADAFRELGAACEAAALFPEDVPKEIWIAAGTYQPQNYFPLAANTSYIGGFAGHETAKSQRNVAANKVVVSGDLGGNAAATVNGDLSFENLEFIGAGIRAELSASRELRVTNCGFKNIQANGAIYIEGGELVISSANFEDITYAGYGAVYGVGLSAVRIDNVNLHNINAAGLYFYECSGDMEINNVDLQNISRGGISITGGNGIRITQTTVKNISCGDGIYGGIRASGGNMVIENVIVENVTNGIGMSLTSYGNGTFRISDSTIKGVKNSSGAGLHITGGSVVVSNTVIENIEADNGAIYVDSFGDLTIIDSTINAITASYGLFFEGSGNTVISNTTINNINAGNYGYAIYAYGTNLVIADTTMDNITAGYGVYGNNLSGVKIDDLALQDIYYGLYFSYCNGDIEINNVDLQNISSSGIYVTNGNGKREFSNITGYNIKGGYNMYVNSGSSIKLTESSFDTSGQIAFYGIGASINISDTTAKNVSATNALYILGENNVIERVNVENVLNGRGIYMNTTGTGRITGSSIKNCTVSDSGGGINLGGPGNVTISNTTIEDVEARNSNGYGGGIYTFSGMTGNLTISDSTIKNAKAASGGGGIYYAGSGKLTISGTTFENCRSDREYGTIYLSNGNVLQEITDTTFLNCAARNGYKFIYMYVYGALVFKRCTFEDNSELYNYDPLTNDNYIRPMFCYYGGYFEDCTFTNLTDNYEGESYIFNRWFRYSWDPNGGQLYDEHGGQFYQRDDYTPSITLKNCRFNFNNNPKAAGLLALYGGQTGDNVPFLSPDYLLMDNVTINNPNNQQHLIWLSDATNGTSTPGIFQFKLNNVYNGTPLNTAAAIIGLAGSGVMRLTNGATPVLVP